VTEQHSTLLAEKNAEITRLRGLLATPAAAVAGTVVDTDVDTVVDTHVDADTDAVLDADAAADADATMASAADVDPATPVAEAVETASLVDVESVDTPSVDVSAVDVSDDSSIDTSIDLAAVEAPSVDVSAAATEAAATTESVATLPAQGGTIAALVGTGEAAGDAAAEPATEGADAGTGTATATQSVIDLSDGEDESSDDLERIEGIGPRIAGALRTAGIHTFAKLADSDVATLQAALEASGLRFAPSLPTWARQSRLLADGDEAGFHALTEQLVAGRDTGRTV
jgi:predicted flap endonuclease-1-like 5' DNA nuclease